MSKQTYRLIITLSADPDAPTFEELMQKGVKDWLERVLGFKS